MIYQDENGLLDLPLPSLLGAHQITNAGAAIAALRYFGKSSAACEAAVTRPEWPARMQRLRQGPLVDAAPEIELWLDGGHNPAGGQAIGATLAAMPKRPSYLICGMLNTKDIKAYLYPLASHIQALHAISIPNEINTLSAENTRDAAISVGMRATAEADVMAALNAIKAQDANARVLICGSLYLAGMILRENG